MAVLTGELALAPLPASPPWLDDFAFPLSPEPETYGYLRGKNVHHCSQPELIE